MHTWWLCRQVFFCIITTDQGATHLSAKGNLLITIKFFLDYSILVIFFRTAGCYLKKKIYISPILSAVWS